MSEMNDSKKTREVRILAIESSCDETAAAVVVNGRDMRSNVISSQIALHTLYGGVVPEIASRKHIEKINQVITQALKDADMTLQDIDAIGVTYGPGLVGALLVGVADAKAISYAANIPLVGVHHIDGHISANYIENPDLKPPFLCLVVSGGHTHLVRVIDYGKYEVLGRTRDDAAGGDGHAAIAHKAGVLAVEKVQRAQHGIKIEHGLTTAHDHHAGDHVRLGLLILFVGRCWLSLLRFLCSSLSSCLLQRLLQILLMFLAQALVEEVHLSDDLWRC